MKLTLIQHSCYHELYLPKKMSGQFFVNYTTARGQNEPILAVVASENGWVAHAGKNATLFYENRKVLGDKEKNYAVLDYGNFIVRCSHTMEDCHLIVSDDTEPMLVFHRYAVNGKIKIGSDKNCDIVLDSKLAEPVAAIITFSDKKTTLESGSNCFVNNIPFRSGELSPSDMVYLYGFRFIIGRSIIAMDSGPKLKVKLSASINVLAPFYKENSLVEQSFDDYDRENFFYVSPRFTVNENYPEIELLPPPQGAKAGDSPVALSLGPAFTMGIASASTAGITLVSGLQQGKEFTEMLPTLIMSTSMVMSSMLWPVINRLYSKVRNTNKEKNRKKVYLQYLDKKETEIKELLERQHNELVLANPTVSQLVERANNRLASLWERRLCDADFLRFYAGTGRVDAAFNLKKNKESIQVEYDSLLECMEKLLNKKYYIDDAPIILSLKENSVTGIVGNRAKVVDYTRNIILQLTTLCSYSELKVVLICNREEERQWSYIRWLPHSWNNQKNFRYIACDTSELKAVSCELEKSLSIHEGNESLPEVHYVVICADQELCSKTNLISNIIQRKNSNVSILALYNETRNLPNECSLIIQLCREEYAEQKTGDASRSLCLKSRSSAQEMYIRPVNFDEVDFAQQAVGLANVKLGNIEGGYKLPDMLTFAEMYKFRNVNELNCLTRWKESNPVLSLAAPLGVDSHGSLMMLDLHQNAHGPHGLIAGTTGSGKSEFIMTLILSLAVNFSPKELAFLLIDYKGGALSKAFTKLPHLAGTITNLDGASLTRSLISIRSECTRRQTLFNQTSTALETTVNDIYKYQRLYREGKVSEPLQHLFVIADEFAELKDQCPDFLDELNSAARIGRSLGIHLILATQKPSGVVTGQIWSNSRFRVCLKVQEASDSKDMIMSPDAAYITQTGRYYLQVGYNEVYELGQSAWAGAIYKPEEGLESRIDDSVQMIDNNGTLLKQATNEIRKQILQQQLTTSAKQLDEKEKKQYSQMETVVNYLNDLCEAENIHSARLWLDPIPATIYAEKLVEKYGYMTDEDKITAVIGEYDIPQQQSQKLLTLSLMDGNTIVYGSSGYGKTTFLVAYIYDVLNRYTAQRATFYILDFASETLKAFEKYNAVGAFITSSEPEKVETFFNFLLKEINRRKAKLASEGVDFSQYFKEHDDLPAMNIIIANYGSFREAFEKEQYDSLVEVLSRDASKYGVYFLLTSVSTTGLRMKIMENFGNVFTLNLNDASYSNVLPKAKKMIPTDCKGRGLCSKDEVYEFQTCYITERTDIFAFINEQAGVINERSACRAMRIVNLPDVVTVDYVKKFITDDNNVVVGIDKLNMQPVYLNLNRFMNVFTAEGSYDLTDIAGALIKLIEDDYHLYVFDISGSLKTKSEDYYTAGEIHDGLKKLAKLMANRSKDNYVPDGKPVICILSEFANIIREDNADVEGEDEQRSILSLLLLYADLGVNFVIFGDYFSFSSYTSAEWFEKFPRDTYFWLGGGINNDSYLFSHSDMPEVSGSERKCSGFSYVNGLGKSVKFISLGKED